MLRPGLRTYKPRRSRISGREARALAEQEAFLLSWDGPPLDLDSVFGPGTPVVVEIGFGDGLATAQMAAADPATGILAIDVHTPGVGDLLDRIGAGALSNVRVIEGDALGVLSSRIPPGSLAGVRSYFPDPWPKARHHKRRLVQPAVLDLVAGRLRPEGTWRLATDWDAYARAMLDCFAGDPRWVGGVIPRPADRPVTRYERRARRDARAITDLEFRLTPSA